MEKNNVLFIFHCGDVNNGGVRSMVDVIDQLVKNKEIKIYAAFPDKSGSALDYLSGIGVEIVPFRLATWHHQKTGNIITDCIDFTKTVLKQYRNLYFLYAVQKYIKEKGINCVYTNTFASYVGAICKRKCGVYHIWHIREFGIQDHNMKPIFGWKLFYHLLNNYTDDILVISNSLYERYAPYVSTSKMHVVYDDVSPEYIIDKTEKNDDTFNLLIAGTLQPGKGQLEAVKAVELALKKCSEIQLYIAGGEVNPYASHVRQYVHEHNLEGNVKFLGYVKNMEKIRSTMDVGLVCSRSEAFGRVTVEGMLAHMVIIGANCAATKELIHNNVNGFLYEAGNVKQLADKICVLYHDRKTLHKIAEAGFNFSREEFASGNCAKVITKCIQNSQRSI